MVRHISYINEDFIPIEEDKPLSKYSNGGYKGKGPDFKEVNRARLESYRKQIEKQVEKRRKDAKQNKREINYEDMDEIKFEDLPDA